MAAIHLQTNSMYKDSQSNTKSRFLLHTLTKDHSEISSKIGINYGQLGNNLPSPNSSIELIKSMNAGRVKLYDANPEILNLLSGTNLQVSIMVPNNEISTIASNQAKADEWVRNNVLPYYPQTMIRYLLVGNEVLSYNSSDQDRQMWLDLVPAMTKIKSSLKAQNITNIKVGTPLAMDVLQSTFPPSNSMFRPDISNSVMAPMLRFLNRTNSFMFIDVYPFFPWSSNTTSISLDFALFRGNNNTNYYTDPGSGLIYTNLLDQMLDSLIYAMAKLGYPNIRLLITETGWPNSGDIEQPGANIHNAATYNRNLIHRMVAKPPLGTPARPGVVIPTFIFSLFDENQKTGPGTERHWGLKKAIGGPRALAGSMVWCVVAKGVNNDELDSALNNLCSSSAGNGTCDALSPGKECHEPVSEILHASYAFSSYWAKFRSHGATCYFNGLAEQTTVDPSHGSCKFPSVTL
ncbi:O-Glycosyl hydrolases family 17 protein [Prunus dulcis]|uniref:glucan endo-1,3-beta-D-glucosidase n=1 Tax=Prunus dulcis TaxID=3755 RepID=A0A4Y1QNI8_PRUDU|nr:O-Glycosyl hydrolases family 17 protein [Prunus dulcis]